MPDNDYTGFEPVQESPEDQSDYTVGRTDAESAPLEQQPDYSAFEPVGEPSNAYGQFHPVAPRNVEEWDPYLAESAAKYGVDPNLLKAIARQENVNPGHMNPLGISPHNGGPATYRSVQEAQAAIDHQVAVMVNPRGPYGDIRTKTIPQIAAVYSPVGASNDVYGTNSTEAGGIASYYHRLSVEDGGKYDYSAFEPVSEHDYSQFEPAQEFAGTDHPQVAQPQQPATPQQTNPWDVGKFLQTFVGSGVQQLLKSEQGQAESQLHPETRKVLPYGEDVQQAKEDAILRDPNTSREEADDIIHQRNQRLAYIKANAQQNVEETTAALKEAQSRVDQQYEATPQGQAARTLGTGGASSVPALTGPFAPLALATQMGGQTYAEEKDRATAAAKKAHPEWTDEQIDAASSHAAENAATTSAESGVVVSLLPVPKIGGLLARAVERIGMRGAYMVVAGAVQDISANKELQNIDPTQALYDGVLARMPANFAAGGAFELPGAIGEAFTGRSNAAPEATQARPEAQPEVKAPEQPQQAPTEQATPQPEAQPTEQAPEDTEKWVSAIANRYSQERSAQGEIGEIAPGEGYSREDLRNVGLRMSPEEINQHVSDLMHDTGNPKLQAAAISAEEARLSQRSAQASRASEDNPNDPQARQAANDAFNDLTDFHNGPVAKLKNNWHAQGMTLQGEVPVDLSTFNGLREAWLRDVGTRINPSLEMTMRNTAARVRNAVAIEDMAMEKLGREIEKPSRQSLPSDEEVRNNIIERMKDEPCRI